LWYNGRQHHQCIMPQAVNRVCAPEDGRNYRLKHVELIGIINKPLLLHLVGCLCYYIVICFNQLTMKTGQKEKCKSKHVLLCLSFIYLYILI